jgi:hypothetical protein
VTDVGAKAYQFYQVVRGQGGGNGAQNFSEAEFKIYAPTSPRAVESVSRDFEFARVEPAENQTLVMTEFTPVIGGATSLGIGVGRVNPVNFHVRKYGNNVTVMGRFAYCNEDDAWTFSVPPGTFGTVISAISQCNQSDVDVPIGITIKGDNEFEIDRDDAIDGSSPFSVIIEGTP